VKTIFSIIAATVVIAACRKQIEASSYMDCFSSQNLDSTAVHNKLIGNWKWTKQQCVSGRKAKKADKTVIAVFNADNTFKVTENGIAEAQGSWKLKSDQYNYFYFEMTPASTYLFGLILFCGNEILFSSSPSDGCDNLFQKQ
jgi:hypothetical protein